MPKAAYTTVPATIKAVTKVTTVPIGRFLLHHAHHIVPAGHMEHPSIG
jgi:hypothetical protein